MKHLPDEAHNAWIVDVKHVLPHLSPLRTLQHMVDFFLGLTTAITLSNEAHFPKRKLACAWSQPWWNMDCMDAAQQLHTTPHTNNNTHRLAHKHLKSMVHTAKRAWAAKTILESSIWDVAQWRHGHCQTQIPALCQPDGSLTYEHDAIAATLSAHFFVQPPMDLLPSQPDDPPPLPK